MTFAHRIIGFNSNLKFEEPLPEGIRIMNPFAENPDAFRISSLFYRKYYSDNYPRRLILGINPGRFGAGVTGIPFTDSFRLKEVCGLEIPGLTTFETSSVFVYDMIKAYGGAESFYLDYFISAVCPLGFVRMNDKGREVNYNYYDDPLVQKTMLPFIVSSLEKQLGFGIDRERCYCLGKNKNYRFLEKLNGEKGYFHSIVPLEHPRFIMQYRLREKEQFIADYLKLLRH